MNELGAIQFRHLGASAIEPDPGFRAMTITDNPAGRAVLRSTARSNRAANGNSPPNPDGLRRRTGCRRLAEQIGSRQDCGRRYQEGEDAGRSLHIESRALHSSSQIAET